MDDRPTTRDANVDVLNDQADDADPVDAAADVIESTPVRRTSDGVDLDATVIHGGLTIELSDGDTLAHQLTPGELLNRLKQGEYYLPTASSDFQDALRTLRDQNDADR